MKVVTERLKIVGMHCASCVLAIEKTLKSVNGVLDAQVNLALNEALVSYDSSRVHLREIVKSVRDAGYDIQKLEVLLSVENMVSVEDEAVVESRLRELAGIIEVSASHLNRKVIVRFNPETLRIEDVVALLNRLGYRASIASEEFEDLGDSELSSMLRWSILSLAIGFLLLLLFLDQMTSRFIPGEIHDALGFLGATLVLFIAGKRFLVGAYRALRNRVANMDTLVALGTLSIYTYSVAVTLGLVEGASHYEAAVFIVAFVLTGRYIEAKVKHVAGEAVKKLLEMQPREVNVLVGGKELRLAIEALKVGDVVVVRQGEKIPVDGIVASGRAYVDESAFTGEPMPREKAEGNVVYAGSIVTNGWIHVVATRIGKETTLAQITKLVSQAQTGKIGIQRLVDRVAGLFTWIMVAVALTTFAAWHFLGAVLEVSLLYMASVLLVACPCALGLATPTAVVAGVSVATREGMVVRNVTALERACEVDVVALDKTGTITVGKPRVVRVIPSPSYSEYEVLRLAAIAEKWSEHPIARAILEKCRDSGLDAEEPEEFESFPGMGVLAKFRGERIAVGNAKLMKELEIRDSIEFSEIGGETIVYVSRNKELVGAIAVADEIKEGAREAIEELRKLGLRVMMLTGDRLESAKAIASKVGIEEVQAELDPEEKSYAVRKLQREGLKVMMVGDGVNDAPSISRADVGVAMGSGADVSKEAGDVVLIHGDLKKIPVLVRISKKVNQRIRFNIFWAFAYNVTLVPIAAGALAPLNLTLKPEMAALAMALSSISVTLSSYMLSKWKP